MKKRTTIAVTAMSLMMSGSALAAGELHIGMRDDPGSLDPATNATFVGRVSLQSRTLNVSIPKGVRAGQHLRLAGQGGPGAGGGPAGDLYLEIAFHEHPRFRVDGADVSLELPVAPWEAALGARVLVPMPDGAVEMTVPKGSAGGRRLRLKGKGFQAKGGARGDQLVTLQVEIPEGDADLAKRLEGWRDTRDLRAKFGS